MSGSREGQCARFTGKEVERKGHQPGHIVHNAHVAKNSFRDAPRSWPPSASPTASFLTLMSCPRCPGWELPAFLGSQHPVSREQRIRLLREGWHLEAWCGHLYLGQLCATSLRQAEARKAVTHVLQQEPSVLDRQGKGQRMRLGVFRNLTPLAPDAGRLEEGQ